MRKDTSYDWSRSGPWSQASKSCLPFRHFLFPVFTFDFVSLQRFIFFFTRPENELMFMSLISCSPDTLWVRGHSLPYASKKWPPRKATVTVISPWWLWMYTFSLTQVTSRILKPSSWHSYGCFLSVSIHPIRGWTKSVAPGFSFKIVALDFILSVA